MYGRRRGSRQHVRQVCSHGAKEAQLGREWCFRGEIKILGFVLHAERVEWFGSVGIPCSSLQPCSNLHQHVFQRGSMFVKILLCLGSSRPEDLGSAGNLRGNLVLVMGVSMLFTTACQWWSWSGSLWRSCQHHLLPFAF